MSEHVSEPLVSIVCITYNSSRYVVETLDSFARQTYRNIELIISDDCSTDDTLAVCREWVGRHGHLFRRVEIVTSDANTGITGNLNRGIRAARGEWIKFMCGDDRLLPHAIESFVSFVGENPRCQIASCRMLLFDHTRDAYDIQDDFYGRLQRPLARELEGQYRELLKRYYIPSPTLFFRRALWEKLGGFDEGYPFLEEDTFMFAVMESGKKVWPLPEKLVEYRFYSDSVSHASSQALNRHERDRMRFYYSHRRPALRRHRMYLYLLDYDLLYLQLRALDGGHTRRATVLSVLRLLSPIRLYRLLCRCIGRE